MDYKEFNKEIKDKLLKIGLTEEQSKITKLFDYMQILLEWNVKMNLTAITEEKEIIQKHFFFFLTIASYCYAGKIIDIGTGAGFPGIPLKIWNQNVEITLLDSLNKRVLFLKEVIKKLELKKINAIHGRAEEIAIKEQFREKYDIAVSRAGSLSISEICVSGLASVLIPYPYAAADHQRKNAKEMEELGASLYLDDADCTPEAFMEKLEEVINNTQKMIELQNNAKKLVKYDATKNIVEQIKAVVK